MNSDDIIRMAVQCQLLTTANRNGVYAEALERFAKMVAAAEREACARICETEWETFQEQQYGYTVASIIRSRNESAT